MSLKIRKAVIPVAGLGTRFLPATKSVPKELLPIVDRPILLMILDEVLASGIADVVLVTGRGKSAIEDFFDTNYELEVALEKSGRQDLLKDLHAIRGACHIISVRQNQALGLGHAVLTARPVVGDAPFAVLLGDEIMLHDDKIRPATETLARLFDETGLSSVAVMEVAASEVSKYGIIQAETLPGNRYRVSSVIEKPKSAEAPSRLALPGRYAFSAKIFSALEETRPGKNGEIQLTDAMTAVAQTEGMLATILKNERFDAGDKLGFLQANVVMGLRHPSLGEPFRSFIKDLAQKL